MKQKNYLLKLWMLLLCVVAGVGNAAAEDKWVKTEPTNLQTGDVVVIVDQTSSRAMSNDKGTTNPPQAVFIYYVDGTDKEELLGDKSNIVPDNLKWTVTVDNGSYQFGVNNSYLYCTATNNGVRVGTNNNNVFTWKKADVNSTEYFLFNKGTSRYLGVYSSQDWRCYTTVNNNIKETVTAFYKKTTAEDPGDTRTEINLTNFTAASTTLTKGETTTTNVETDAATFVPDIIYSTSNEAVATVDANGVISAVGKGTAAITATLNISAEDEYYKAGTTKSMSVDITVINPKHTVSFLVNGGTFSSAEVEEGETITFPTETPADIEGKEFVGWVAEPITGTTDTAPTFVTSATMGENDVTYYAVFASVEQGSASLTKMTASDTFVDGDKVAIVATSEGTSYGLYQETINNSYVNNYVFTEDYSDVTNDDKKWWTVSAGTDNKWKLGDSTNGYLYSSGSNNLSVDASNATEWTLENNNDGTFKLKGARYLSCRSDLSGNNQYLFRLAGSTPAGTYSFSIYKIGAGVSFSDYCTTVVAATVERPVITVADNPFCFTTTATITCVTEGATIKYSFDGENWSDYTSALTITETKTIYAKAVKDNDESAVAQVTATKNLAETTVTVSGELTLDLNGETNVSAGTLTAAVTYNESSVDGATVTWSSSDSDIATIDPSTGAVTLVATGEVTFTATYAGSSDYAEATGSKTITVIDSKAPGTEQNPYTVAEAIAATPSSGYSKTVYIRGIVSQFYNTSIVGDGSNYRYYISDDGTTTSQLLVYKGKGLNNVAFSSADDLQLGDVVVITGQLTTYSNTPEVASGNYIVSIERIVKPAITVAQTTVSVGAAGGEGTIDVTYTKIDTDLVDVQFYTADGTEVEATSYDWIAAEISQDKKLSYVVVENTGEARTAYLKVYSVDDNGGDDLIYSDLITISQAAASSGNQFALFNGELVEGDYIIYYNGYAMNTTVSNSRLQYEEVTPDNNIITTDNASIVWHIAPSGDYWTIYSADADAYAAGTGFKNQAQMLSDGTDDKALWTVSGNKTYEFINKKNNANNVNKNLRNNGTNGFACYSTQTGGALSLYKRASATITLAASGYASYCCDKALDFSTNSKSVYRAWYVSDVTGTTVTFSEITGKVKAGEGIILYGTPGAKCSLPYANNGEELTGNMLRGTLEPTEVTTEMVIDGQSYTLFGLSNGQFVKMKNGTVKANKAFLPILTSQVPTGSNARLDIVFSEETDGIKSIENGKLTIDNSVYDLQGRRVETMKKGSLYIVNGKKFVSK